jgi:hypothetical protein
VKSLSAFAKPQGGRGQQAFLHLDCDLKRVPAMILRRADPRLDEANRYRRALAQSL